MYVSALNCNIKLVDNKSLASVFLFDYFIFNI